MWVHAGFMMRVTRFPAAVESPEVVLSPMQSPSFCNGLDSSWWWSQLGSGWEPAAAVSCSICLLSVSLQWSQCLWLGVNWDPPVAAVTVGSCDPAHVALWAHGVLRARLGSAPLLLSVLHSLRESAGKRCCVSLHVFLAFCHLKLM